MARQPGNQTNEQLFCWEQVDKTNRLFRVSHAFAPPEHRGKLLPLYALFSVVEEVCSGFPDEQLARSKLAWWRREILGRNPDGGSHPIIAELSRGASLSRFQKGCVERLLEDADSRLDGAPPPSLEDLRRRCAKVSRPQMELELSLCGVEEPDTAGIAAGQAARTGLVQLLRESLRARDTGAFWWLPLDLLARHGISRAEVRSAPGAEPAQAMLRELLAESQAWGDDSGPLSNGITAPPGAMSHLLVHGELQSRLLARLRGKPPGRYRAEVGRTTLADLYHAWKTARRVNRP
jgi:phytoene synthase